MPANAPRLTPQTTQLLALLLATPTEPRYGRDLARETGLKTGTVHPILARLELAGWIDSFWEDPAEHEDQGRPRRRYYRLTDDGERAARAALADTARQSARTPATNLRTQPGYQW
ncbi:helix-turn-helix transcriptional regulator [Micromonospora sp. WMMC241]|uniref:Transcriptional regulator, PadR family n=1 Tax=Micromonospora humi TaxID=745366 RepID=A0A1C5H7L7_9ACTN|nr:MULTISPECIES: helix-turn-helix transcriptional regulator [Micromonospora]MCZ7437817.1 helix-turn-helix transcriptional regulator [Micromonospora sp. WMMC241]SCG41897.1 transcriptional regulator, PadR family [Micromonospora humi]